MNNDFHNWLSTEFEKYPMLNLSWKRGSYTMNELTYVLRRSGQDFCINIEDPDDRMSFGFIPSVQDTFIPTSDLMRKVKSINKEDCEESEYAVLTVVYKSK